MSHLLSVFNLGAGSLGGVWVLDNGQLHILLPTAQAACLLEHYQRPKLAAPRGASEGRGSVCSLNQGSPRGGRR